MLRVQLLLYFILHDVENVQGLHWCINECCDCCVRLNSTFRCHRLQIGQVFARSAPNRLTFLIRLLV